MAFTPATIAQAEALTEAKDYTIVSGDYLSKIAEAHDTTWQKLYDKNTNIKDPNLIYAGDKITIPASSEAVAPRTNVEAPVAVPTPEPAPAPAPAPAPVVEAPVQPAPAPVSAGTNCDVARSLINQYGWNADVAYQVMLAESGCNPNAANWNDQHANCAGSFGLFQINCGHGQLYDPAANVAQAYKMYQASGWQPWGFTTCAVKVSCY